MAVVLKVGDLVRAVNHIGVYRIVGFSSGGVIAEIQGYDVTKGKPKGELISVSVTILRRLGR
jgi:hypothetical protein